MSSDNEATGSAALDADLPVSLQDMKDWLRIAGGDEEDGLLAGLIAAAVSLCEGFTGQWVMIRQSEWRGLLYGGGTAIRLKSRPLVAVDDVIMMERGQEVALNAAAYRLGGDRAGAATLQLVEGYGWRQMLVRYRAGIAQDRAGVPDALRHGIVRMVQHLYETRDRPVAEQMPPAAVAALWQPWRRIGLGGRP